MKNNSKIKIWELSLILALVITLGLSCFGGEAAARSDMDMSYAWWGVIFPELDISGGYTEAFAEPGEEGIEVRWRLLEFWEKLREMFSF